MKATFLVITSRCAGSEKTKLLIEDVISTLLSHNCTEDLFAIRSISSIVQVSHYLPVGFGMCRLIRAKSCPSCNWQPSLDCDWPVP